MQWRVTRERVRFQMVLSVKVKTIDDGMWCSGEVRRGGALNQKSQNGQQLTQPLTSWLRVVGLWCTVHLGFWALLNPSSSYGHGTPRLLPNKMEGFKVAYLTLFLSGRFWASVGLDRRLPLLDKPLSVNFSPGAINLPYFW